MIPTKIVLKIILKTLSLLNLKSRWQPYHSPMAYLRKAIADVLLQVRSERDQELLHAARESEIAAERAREADNERREAEEWARKEQAFEIAFPEQSQQQEIIEELRQRLQFSFKGVGARRNARTPENVFHGCF